MKKTLVLLLLLTFTIAVMALPDIALPTDETFYEGTVNITGARITDGTISNADVAATAAIDGSKLDLTSAGAIVATTIRATGAVTLSNNVYMGSALIWYNIIVDGNLIHTVTAMGAITNGQVLSREGTFVTVAPTTAVTNTIEDPLTVGRIKTIINTSTNAVTIADSGNVRLDGAFAGGLDAALLLQARATNIWVEIGRKAN